MKRELAWVVENEGIRPAGKPDRCFYCNQPKGETHLPSCVIRERTVIVRMSVEYVVKVPEAWTNEDIENHRNASSWCALNGLAEIERIAEHHCLCGVAHFDYVREATTEDEETFQVFVKDCKR